MSITKEDTIYEIFSFIRSSDKVSKVWSEKIKEIKKKRKYIEPYELYCLAYTETKLELNIK